MTAWNSLISFLISFPFCCLSQNTCNKLPSSLLNHWTVWQCPPFAPDLDKVPLYFGSYLFHVKRWSNVDLLCKSSFILWGILHIIKCQFLTIISMDVEEKLTNTADPYFIVDNALLVCFMPCWRAASHAAHRQVTLWKIKEKSVDNIDKRQPAPVPRVHKIRHTHLTCLAYFWKCPARGFDLAWQKVNYGQCLANKCPAKSLIFIGYFTVKCKARIQNVRWRTGGSPYKMSGEAQINFVYSAVPSNKIMKT